MGFFKNRKVAKEAEAKDEQPNNQQAVAPELYSVEPLDPDSELAQSLFELASLLSGGDSEVTDLLKEALAEETEIPVGCDQGQKYYSNIKYALWSGNYLLRLEGCWDEEDVLDDIDSCHMFTKTEVDFECLYFPEEAGIYRICAVLADELEDNDLYLGRIESPLNYGISGKEWSSVPYSYYYVFIADSILKKKVLALSELCGLDITFDWSDRAKLAAPRDPHWVVDWSVFGKESS